MSALPCVRCGGSLGKNGIAFCDGCLGQMQRPWWKFWRSAGPIKEVGR